VNTYFVAGNVTAPTTTSAFISPTFNITITATTQKVIVVSSAALGASANNGAAGLTLAIGHRPAAGGTVTKVSELSGLSIGAKGTVPMSITSIITGLAPGTYTIGIVGDATAGNSWNQNGAAHISAFLAN
jgi:hypothetical protein